MNDFLKTIMERRSIRKYTADQVPDEVLEQILYASAFSPNAGNRQTTQIVVCQDRKLNERLGRINKAAFSGRVSSPDNMISKDQPSIADDPSIISAFYGAPTVITLFGPRNFLYTEADCYIMANNICLAAYSLGVGSCIMGRAEETFESELGSAMQKEWGVTENFEAKVHITLGYPKDGFPQSKNRKYPNPIVIRDEVE